jgi:hypothetical protein
MTKTLDRVSMREKIISAFAAQKFDGTDIFR